MPDQPIYVVMQDPHAYAQPQPRNGGRVLIRLAIVAGLGYAIYRLHEENERRRKEEAARAVKTWEANKTTI